MADNTAIEWADRTWNPLLGCSRVSPGCDGCYAITTATIRAGNPHPKVAAAFAGLTERQGGRLDWTGRINLLPDRMDQPLGWKKPSKIFVNSQSDLFHKDVPLAFIEQVFAVMARTPQHTYQLLTKRHARMSSILRKPTFRDSVAAIVGADIEWPLPNLWLGVSVEDQHWADIRIPALLDTPAAVRWLSCEPLLGPINLSSWIGDTDGRPAVSRGGCARSGEIGRVADRQSGSSMAGGGPARQPLDTRDEGHPLRTQASRELDRQVPTSTGHVQLDEIPRDGSPTGVVALRGADSAGPHGEPQERNLVGQPPVELGASYPLGAGHTRPDGAVARPIESVRDAELDGSVDFGSGSGDSGTASGRGAAADVGERVRGALPAHISDRARGASISWIVVGGESGPKARPMQTQWARDLRDQCVAAGVPFFFKQHGEWVAPSQMPADTFMDWDIKNGTDAFDRDAPWRMGKKRAGRLLDGREWNEYPADRAAVA